MVEVDGSVHTSRHSIVKENNFPTKRCTKDVKINKENTDESTGDEDHDSIFDDSADWSELGLHRVPAEPKTTEDFGKETRDSHSETAEDKNFGSQDVREEGDTPEQTLRRSTRMRKGP